MRARVYKRSGGRWYLDFSDHRGKRVRRWVPEAKTKADAQDALHRALDKEAKIRDGVIDLLDNSAEVADLLDAFLLHKLSTRRYGTVHFYRVAFSDVLGRLVTPDGKVWPPTREAPVDEVQKQSRRFETGALGIERVEEITPERLAQYVEARKAHMAVRTVNKSVLALKTLLSWARKAGKIKSNPIADVSRVGKPARSGRALTVDEVEALLDVSPEPYRTMWLAFLTTGMRLGELVNLRWPQVCLETNTVRIAPETSKSKRQRDVPILPELRERLVRLRAEATDPEGYVFTNQDGGQWVNNLGRRFARCVELALVGRVVRRDGVWHLVYREDGQEAWEPLPDVKGWRAAKAELLKRRGSEAGGVSIHTLRHTYATQLLLNGVNPKVVSELLGHSSITVTLDIYGHVFPRNKQEAVAALPFGQGRTEQKGHLGGTGEETFPQLRLAQ